MHAHTQITVPAAQQLTTESVDAHLFADERRLNAEVQRFLAFAARHSDDDSLHAQLRPILNVSGKRIRPLLPFWLSRAVDPQGHAAREDAIARVAVATLVLHSAAIVIDDIEDGSLERQAQTTLHLRNGIGPTLNSASLLIFAALEYLNDPALLALGVDTISKCHLGQALDLGFGDPRVARPLFDAGAGEREERWLSCTRYKTSQLMEWSVRAAGHVLGLAPVVIDGLAGAMVNYGIGYQILDDVKNFRPDLVGAKAYEDVPRGLRNWVCLELFAAIDRAQLVEAKAMYGSMTFTNWVVMHPELPAAIARSMDEARTYIARAEQSLTALTGGRARGYIETLLTRPLEDLMEVLDV